MKITLQQLIDRGACPRQVRLFKRCYGESVRVTKRECLAAAHLFEWSWAAINLFTERQRRTYYHEINRWWDSGEYTSLGRAYREARALAFWKASRG